MLWHIAYTIWHFPDSLESIGKKRIWMAIFDYELLLSRLRGSDINLEQDNLKLLISYKMGSFI